MTADNATIHAVAEAIKNTGAVVYRYTDLACAAIAKLEELGWGKKPTVTEARSIIDKKITFGTESTRERVTAALIEAGLAVEDPEPEWEPTEEAVEEATKVYAERTGSIESLLKHIRANPHLVGMREDDEHP